MFPNQEKCSYAFDVLVAKVASRVCDIGRTAGEVFVVIAAAHGPAMEPIIDQRSRPSEAVPVVMMVTFSQPGMHPLSASVVIDNELPGDSNWDTKVAAASEILAGLVYGIYGVMAPRSSAEHAFGFRTGLRGATDHRNDES